MKDQPQWHKLEVRGRSEKIKKKDFIVDCKKINFKKIDYKSYTATSFNEIFSNKYSSKPVKLSGELYLPKKKVNSLLYIFNMAQDTLKDI